jgi:hypothetical protein
VHPAITAEIISDMQERRLRRAADRARAGGLRSGLLAAIRARLTARRTAAPERPAGVRVPVALRR